MLTRISAFAACVNLGYMCHYYYTETNMLNEADVYLAGAECSKIRPQFFTDNKVDGDQAEHSSLAHTALSVVITLTAYQSHTLSHHTIIPSSGLGPKTGPGMFQLGQPTQII